LQLELLDGGEDAVNCVVSTNPLVTSEDENSITGMISHGFTHLRLVFAASVICLRSVVVS
jgi:hypothetical protein